MCYLDGVILVRSSPIVLMTRRPRIHRPREIPTPPYTRIQRGVAAFSWTTPWLPMSHRDTRGPIALLGTTKSHTYIAAPGEDHSRDYIYRFNVEIAGALEQKVSYIRKATSTCQKYISICKTYVKLMFNNGTAATERVKTSYKLVLTLSTNN